ncbi:MAG: endonuclease/exonuclease/phosphatase family protein [Elusimicrobia bacterium]|nr:endonuclease/exonuclease/phosphatase family protein [Elusimicrobiota bacterium]
MRILTYNSCALPLLTGDIGRRLTLAAEAITRLEPELILLQEIFLTSQLAAVRSGLARWPHAAWEPRSFARVAGGLCLLSKRPIRRWGFASFAEQGPAWRFSSLVRLSPKGFLWAELENPATLVVHTHLVADYRIGVEGRNPYPSAQAAQLGQIAAHIGGLAGPATVIVAGDLNMRPDAPALRRFLDELRLSDAMEHSTTPSVIEEPYYRLPFLGAPNRRFDYVLFRGPSGEATAEYVLGERPLSRDGRAITLSDHLGVLAELRSL